MKTTNLEELLKAETPMWFKPKDEDEMLELQIFLAEYGLYSGFGRKYFFDFQDNNLRINKDCYNNKRFNIVDPDNECYEYFYDLETGKLEIPWHENFRKALRDRVWMFINPKNTLEFLLAQMIAFNEGINHLAWQLRKENHQDLIILYKDNEAIVFKHNHICDEYIMTDGYNMTGARIGDTKQFDFENDHFVEEEKEEITVNGIKYRRI